MESEDKLKKLDERYLRMALIWAENSYCQRRKVGALVVKDKMLISDGFNGTPSGFENVCEDENQVTPPYVLHAEGVSIKHFCPFIAVIACSIASRHNVRELYSHTCIR